MPAPIMKQTAAGILPADIFKRSDLEKLAKKLDKSMMEALDTVVDVIRNTELDPKLRLDASKFLLETKVKVSDAMTKETMQKAVLMVKAQAATGLNTINQDQQAATWDFNHIQKIEGVNYSATEEDGSVDLTYLKTQ